MGREVFDGRRCSKGLKTQSALRGIGLGRDSIHSMSWYGEDQGRC